MAFDPKKFTDESIEYIKKRIGNKKAIIALSGGVDSSVCAILTNRAIDNKLISVFVDTGFMRKDEPQMIKNLFEKKFHLNFKIVDARDEFFEAIRRIRDPEEKRKVMGKKFIDVFERIARKEKAQVLVQGTIAPDWIESDGKIKAHHNVGGLPSELNLEIVEPIRELYKDEVRILARSLELPDEISERMPFPGPGLGVRVLGEVTPEKIEIVRNCDAIVKEEIEKSDIKSWQAFAALLEGKSTGVKGDSREYGYMIALRIVDSLDAMTANIKEVDWKILRKISDRITREVPGVTRVLYDLTNKPPATIEFE